MGCGPSQFAASSFDPPTPGPTIGALTTKYITSSHLYCLSQHAAEWPDYYCLVDCRTFEAFDKGHIVGAASYSRVADSLASKVDDSTVVLYDKNEKTPAITKALELISQSGKSPTNVFIFKGNFAQFKKRYRVAMSDFDKVKGEHPGPIELMAATRQNPAVYAIRRNHFQHCKTIVAYLGCETVINISSRRLFLKTGAIKLQNIQFDSVNEPYDEAIACFAKYAGEKPKNATKHNVLLIDETECSYSALLVGWHWYLQGAKIDDVCEHLTNKLGELDSWYTDVLRAWASSTPAPPPA